jgi:hypothetical protein
LFIEFHGFLGASRAITNNILSVVRLSTEMLEGSALIYGARRSRRFNAVMQKDAEAGQSPRSESK